MGKTDILLLHSVLPLLATVVCFKLVLKLVGRRSCPTVKALFLNLLALAATQTVGYWVMIGSPNLARYFADAYLISAYFFFAHIVLFALYLSNKTHRYTYLIYTVPAILTVLHLAGFMVESYRWEHNSLMHNDGAAAGGFDLFALVSLISCIAILLANTRSTRDRVTKSKNLIMIYSFVPLFIMFGVLALLSATDYAVSAALVSPLTIIYTSLAYYYISSQDIVDCSNGPNHFIGRLKLAYMLLKTGTKQGDLKAFKKALDDQIIAESMARHNNNIAAVAKEMNVHHTTLRNKIKESPRLSPFYKNKNHADTEKKEIRT